MPKQPVLHIDEERQLEAVLQGWILSAISASRKEYGKWVFHGGTALKQAFQSMRYSEDLDFMVEPNLDTKLLMQKVVDQVTVQAKLTWPNAAISLKARAGDKNPRMYHVVLTNPDMTMSSVKVKVEFCETVGLAAYAKTAAVIPPQTAVVRNTVGASPSAIVEVGNLDQIYIDKWIALTMRPEIKHRDVWDLSWLLEKQSIQQIPLQEVWTRMQSIVANIYPNNDASDKWLLDAKNRLKLFHTSEYRKAFRDDMLRWLDSAFQQLPENMFDERVARVQQVFEGLVFLMEQHYDIAKTSPN